MKDTPEPPLNDLLRDTAQRASRYLAALDERSVVPSPGAVAGLSRLDEPLSDAGLPAEAVLALLDDIAGPATVASAGPRYFGFVTGGALPASLAANWLAGAWDQNTAFAAAAPATSRLEAIALRWLVDLFGLPASTEGAFVTGATLANTCALAAARQALLARSGWDADADGLYGAPPLQVIVSDQAHASVHKALGLLGLGRRRVVAVPSDSQGRLRADRLPPLSGPTLICAQVGHVNTGACDDIGAIVAHARNAADPASTWVHVDGAFGLWLATSPRRCTLVPDVALADSWATDAHKWLNVPYDSGIAFVRDGAALRAAMSMQASYLPVSGAQRDPSATTPELSRRARGVEVWAALRHLGRDGVAALVERCCKHASGFAAGLTALGFEVLNVVEANQVLVSFGTDVRTLEVIAALQAEGTCWCGGTQWQGRAAMRISVSSWATREQDVMRSLDAIRQVTEGLRRSSS